MGSISFEAPGKKEDAEKGVMDFAPKGGRTTITTKGLEKSFVLKFTFTSKDRALSKLNFKSIAVNGHQL
jgi:hypothetical protein